MLYFITEGNYIRIKDGDNDFRLLHKTSNCINWTVTDKIDLSIDEVTFEELNPSELTFDGVAASTADGVINSLKGMFTGLQAAKVYRALLTQSGTDAPVATVYDNTISQDLIWVRQGIGDYQLQSASNSFSGNVICGLWNFKAIRTQVIDQIVDVFEKGGDDFVYINAAGDSSITDYGIEILVYP
jgi:hypothetical protein